MRSSFLPKLTARKRSLQKSPQPQASGECYLMADGLIVNVAEPSSVVLSAGRFPLNISACCAENQGTETPGVQSTQLDVKYTTQQLQNKSVALNCTLELHKCDLHWTRMSLKHAF